MDRDLEEIAGEERKIWNKLKEDMERKIEALNAGSSRKDVLNTAGNAGPSSRPGGDMETDTPASSEDLVPLELKMETTSEPRQTAPTSYPSTSSVPQESVDGLKAEIQRLRERCAEMENALRAIRDDSRSMEDIVKTLLDRANSMLQD